jgi:hypothetical protein
VQIISVPHAHWILAGWINTGRSEALEISGKTKGRAKMDRREGEFKKAHKIENFET